MAWQSILNQLCACLEFGPSDGTSPEQLNLLHQGGKFVRSLYLGFSSQELQIELSSDNAIIKWKTVDSSSTEFGEIDFSGNIKTVKSTGQQGLQFIDRAGKNIFEVQAEDTATRDKWIVALNELLTLWDEQPDKRPVAKLSSTNNSNKADYFKKREEEILRKEAESAERKKKYSSGGMKYTALAMASRAT